MGGILEDQQRGLAYFEVSDTNLPSVLNLKDIILVMSRCRDVAIRSEWILGKGSVCNNHLKYRIQSCNEDPSSSSVHFQMSKNLRRFEDLKPKIPKIFGKILH